MLVKIIETEIQISINSNNKAGVATNYLESLSTKSCEELFNTILIYC